MATNGHTTVVKLHWGVNETVIALSKREAQVLHRDHPELAGIDYHEPSGKWASPDHYIGGPPDRDTVIWTVPTRLVPIIDQIISASLARSAVLSPATT